MNHQLLDKYFKGLCTEAEQEQVEAWLDQQDNRELDGYLMTKWDEPTPVKEIRRIPWLRMAAAAAVLGIIATTAYLLQTKTMPQTLHVQHMDTLSNNGPGVKLVHMPDGTAVWLNGYSMLMYDETYNVKKRELWLKGEAYFEVETNQEKPFSVNAGGLITTALGTSFNIATPSYSDSSIHVSLISGKVAVSAEDTAVAFSKILLPGNRISYRNNREYKESTFTPGEATDWKEGKLIFDNTPLDEVFAKLQRRYGQAFILTDKAIAAKRMTATFPLQVSLELVLKKMSFVQRISYSQKGDSTFVHITKD
ncbi:FecR family protein [Chitinophaga niabensis]|uniref:Ferric-dicitrate binding protein FerR, regulates iron transport through sigma-19 n=1 Tax=Chitinophaga niabensis TaxID=536979 RepID=A0A1N6GR53_9BACT|nr:FecR domain-containing protein [Chitinophaga niabensis]SIO09973.1 ferric-dicitrate binding protein FerR, regulates iron transport through sigma-19 [Chitinophaga niabensis]